MSIIDDAIAQDVRTYAAQVRLALADLGPDQVDDLTDGLEANLADALADDHRAHRGTLVDEFGEPSAYAAELRAAAGLAPAGAPARRENPLEAALLAPWRSVRDGWRALDARLRTTRWYPGTVALLADLRPAWWVLRGWTLAYLLLALVGAGSSGWLPTSSGGWVVLLVAVVASAQWGRGQWRVGPRWDRLLRGLSRVLAFAGVVLLLSVSRSAGGDAQAAVYETPVPEDGVVVAGERAFNLFVYDAEGNPVDGAQVFDQDGRPVTTEPYGGDRWMQQEYWPTGEPDPVLHVGVPGVNGETRWNVFPLHSVGAGAWADTSAPLDLSDDAVRDQVRAPAWPFAAAAPVTPWAAAPAPGEDASAPTDATSSTSAGTAAPAPTTDATQAVTPAASPGAEVTPAAPPTAAPAAPPTAAPAAP